MHDAAGIEHDVAAFANSGILNGEKAARPAGASSDDVRPSNQS